MQTLTEHNMGIAETPGRDNETGEPNGGTPDQSPSKECARAPTAISEVGSDKKGIKTTVILITVVIAVAIFGIAFTIVRQSRRGGETSSSHQPITDDPFKVNATGSYSSIEELRIDIEALAKNFANTIILEQANDNYRSNDEHFMFAANDGAFMNDAAPALSSNMVMESAPASESSSKVFRGVSDFETYQHEAGVVKNDLVKSNGVHVFAASGNHIQVWDLEGNRFEATQISAARFKDNWAITIVAMLMNPDGDMLTVIASDYSNYYNQIEDMPIIDFDRETQVTTFSIEGSSLTEISQAYIDGHHVESYSLGNNVHIVTRMSLRTWAYFDDNLWRFNFENVTTNDDYVTEATKVADEIIPNFVDKVIDLFTEGDKIVLSRLVGFQNSMSNYKTITQIYSFDTNKIDGEGGIQFAASKSMVLTPGNTGHVYATNKWIWVADENFAWDVEQQGYVQQTMLLGFRIEGVSSYFAALGTIPGQILSQFSIDFVEENDNEYVRIAITQNSFQNMFWGPRPMPMPMPMQEGTDSDDDNFLNETEESRTLNEVVIFGIPQVEGESPEVNELVKLGSLEVGKIHETITAVRFFDNISYVVTFERTDPFYVLDLSDPLDPKILGELEVPGFSEFMHPIKEDNSILITVGKDADENGFVTGFQISIFDSTIPNDPQLVDRLVIENSGSSSSWDERAFRYVQVGGVGRLIIPLYSYGWEKSFDGFTVFGIHLNNTEMITREIDINHLSGRELTSVLMPDERRCFCSLPGRSFIFDGDLMTMKASSVFSTDLVTQEIQWTLSLQDNGCC